MALSGIASVGFHASSQAAVQSLTQHKHGGQRPPSISDVDAMGSSVASAPSPTGKIGSKLNITA
jgi:hypothetical protein